MCDPAEMRGSALNQRGLGLGGLFALGGVGSDSVVMGRTSLHDAARLSNGHY